MVWPTSRVRYKTHSCFWRQWEDTFYRLKSPNIFAVLSWASIRYFRFHPGFAWSRHIPSKAQDQELFPAHTFDRVLADSGLLPTAPISEGMLWEVAGHLFRGQGRGVDSLTFPSWAEKVRLLEAPSRHLRGVQGSSDQVSWLHQSLAVWPWARCFTFLSLSCKVRLSWGLNETTCRVWAGVLPRTW